MQATDTVTDRDFARKAATAARWTGRALWFVLRVLGALFVVLSRLVGGSRPSAESGPDLHGWDPSRRTEFGWGTLRQKEDN